MAESDYAERLRAFLGPGPADLAASGAKALAPQLYSIMAGQPAPPPPNLPDAPAKVPSWSDKRIPSAMMEGAEALSNFVGPGAGAKAGAAGLAAAIPIIGSRAGRAAMEATPKPKGIVAYHGSPYDFDRFALEKIGTGEGAQAYGHGLYFAEKEAVAKAYRDSVQGRNVGGIKYDYTNPDHVAAEAIERLGSRDAAIEALKRDIGGRGDNNPYRATLEAAKSVLEKGEQTPSISKSHMYQVRLNAEPERFLDWDKPLGKMSDPVRKSLSDAWLAHPEAHVGQTGEEIYRANTPGFVSSGPYKEPDHARASHILREAGIPGIKYLDQGSRSAGEGSRNYVVFDPGIIEILKKYGLAGAVAAPSLAAPLAEFLQPQPRAAQ